MKFLHTSDWHVGKTLKGRDRLDEQRLVLLLRQSTILNKSLRGVPCEKRENRAPLCFQMGRRPPILQHLDSRQQCRDLG